MKTGGSEHREWVGLDRRHWDMPVNLNVRHYRQLCRRMDRQLRKLEMRWAHLAVVSYDRIFDEKPVK
jgi:hypothetical protein